jgi:hypothetical protein
MLASGRLPENIHFALEDQTELYLPVSDLVLRRLYDALKGRMAKASKDRAINEIKRLRAELAAKG